MYKEKQIESTILEIIEANLKNKIVGYIYKHPNVLIAEFTNDYMNLLLEKLSREKKEVILMGNFNICLLNYDLEKDTTDLVDTMYGSSFYPTINTPTRITVTSKTLIYNIFYNDFTKKFFAGNITTSIFDHLTQYLTIRDQTTNVEDNREKDFPKIRKFNKDSF